MTNYCAEVSEKEIELIQDGGQIERETDIYHHSPRPISICAADFSLLNLPKGKSLGRSKPATNS